MILAILSTQSPTQSTLAGRIMPLATHWAKQPDTHIHILCHEPIPSASTSPNVTFHSVGQNPFQKTSHGKKRLTGSKLILRIASNIIQTLRALQKTKPTHILISKPLPQNAAAALTWSLWSRIIQTPVHIITDMDDYELTANQLTSLWQRAAIHWSQTTALRLSQKIITASPFLEEYARQLKPSAHPTTLLTSLELPPTSTPLTSDTTHPTILYIGSLSITSGHRIDLLPDILAGVRQKFPHITLRLAGDGDDVATLKQAFATKNLSSATEFTGRFTPKDLPELLKNVTLIIDPIDSSITNRAKSSYRAALAATLGLPIITSNVGVRDTWIPPQFHTRFFATPGDTASYQSKVIAALSDPLTQTQQDHFKNHAQTYTWAKIANTYYNHLKSL